MEPQPSRMQAIMLESKLLTNELYGGGIFDKYYKVRNFEMSVYEMMGIKHFKAFVMRRNRQQDRLTSYNEVGLIEFHERTKLNEKRHIAWLAFCSIAELVSLYAFNHFSGTENLNGTWISGLAAGISGYGLTLNIYLVPLQRYTRANIESTLARIRVHKKRDI
jgi:hypothetical protein